VIIICIVFCSSCDEPIRTNLTPNEQKILDSLYSKRVSNVRKQADSICEMQYDSIFRAAKDSFYRSYMLEIEEMYNDER